MCHFNLLQAYFDLQCEMFINGYLEYDTFEYLEKEFIKKSSLFTVCLN